MSYEYGMCNACGAMKKLYDCFYCDDEDGKELCWDCLQEHKSEYHRMEK